MAAQACNDAHFTRRFDQATKAFDVRHSPDDLRLCHGSIGRDQGIALRDRPSVLESDDAMSEQPARTDPQDDFAWIHGTAA